MRIGSFGVPRRALQRRRAGLLLWVECIWSVQELAGAGIVAWLCPNFVLRHPMNR